MVVKPTLQAIQTTADSAPQYARRTTCSLETVLLENACLLALWDWHNAMQTRDVRRQSSPTLVRDVMVLEQSV